MSERPPIFQPASEPNPFVPKAGVEELKGEKEALNEAEPNREAMDKIVDFLVTENLKYRDMRSQSSADLHLMVSTLETGVPTPQTDFFYKPLGRLDKAAKHKIRSKEHNRQKGNVFYPEGMLKVFRDKLLSTQETEYYDENKPYLHQEGFIEDAVYEFIEHLDNDQFGRLMEIDGIDRSNFNELSEGADKGRLRWRILMGNPNNFRLVLENKEAWEALRREWLKLFFARKEVGIGLQSEAFQLSFGLVLSPEVRVAVSPHEDYPMQATIMSPRVKPKDIIGVYINADTLRDAHLFDDESIHTEDSSKMTVWEQLKKAVYRYPEYPVEYSFLHYSRPFILFMENEGIKADKLKAYFDVFSSLKDLIEHQIYRENKENKDVINEEFRKILGGGYQELEMLAKRFLEEKSPIKDGETLMVGLKRLAELHQLPIYNTRGDLLWPKKMEHEELARFVAKKKESGSE
ncbi:MAG: hypothetical protein WC750_04195 [Patescibacteria group bacterium]|jgi:hypothetical protein